MYDPNKLSPVTYWICSRYTVCNHISQAVNTSADDTFTGSDEKIAIPSDIVRVIEEELQNEGITVILEPGRSLVGNAGILATKVIGVKKGHPHRY